MPQKVLPNYETVPLRSEEVRVAIVQSRLRAIDPDGAAAGRQANLAHMLYLADYAQSRGHKDLLAFHEFPLGGLRLGWSRDEALKVAIEVPGPETDAIGKKAREHDCYIEFGCYARLTDWPRHFFNLGVIVAPSGAVIYRRWWLRNLPGVAFTTSVYDVLEEYVERYGKDAIFPVARTDIGNLALMSEVMEPELRKAFAMRGAELGIHYMVRGAPDLRPEARRKPQGSAAAALPEGRQVFKLDFQAQCLANQIYGLFIMNAVSEEDGAIVDGGVGDSALFGPNGVALAEAPSHHECFVEATIPIAAYRKRHSVPRFHKDLLAGLYGDYTAQYPPNSYLKSLPDSAAAAAEQYRRLARW